jgi:hypothetical protein
MRIGLDEPGDKQDFPSELLADEYQTMLSVCQVLVGEFRKDSRRITLRQHENHRISIQFVSLTFDRVLPIPKDTFDEFSNDLINPSVKPSELALTLTASRFDISDSTVKNARAEVNRDPNRCRERSSEERLIASIFLDLCSLEFDAKVVDAIDEVISTLILVRYPAILFPYLIQAGQKSNRPLVASNLNVEDIHLICDEIRKSSNNGDAS